MRATILRRGAIALGIVMAPVAHADALPSTLAETATPGDPKAPCRGAAYRQLDLWLGDWRVYDGKTGQQVAVDRVTADYGHCVIRQQMRFLGQMYRHPGTPFALAGTSISRFDGRQWLQLWADNQWGAIVLKGGRRDDGAIELNSIVPSRGRDMRLVWVQAADGLHIEQYGSHAGSGQWERYPDMVYRRVARRR
jgi:hypothetical protein